VLFYNDSNIDNNDDSKNKCAVTFYKKDIVTNRKINRNKQNVT
jgi:hypothetical protein